MISHIRGLFDGLTGWNKGFSVALFDHSHEVAYDLGEIFCQSVDIRHNEPKIFIRK